MEAKDNQEHFKRLFSELRQTTEPKKFIDLSRRLIEEFGLPTGSKDKGLGDIYPIRCESTQLVIPFSLPDGRLLDMRLNRDYFDTPDFGNPQITVKERLERDLNKKGSTVMWDPLDGTPSFPVDTAQFRLLVAIRPKWSILSYSIYSKPEFEGKQKFLRLISSKSETRKITRYSIIFADKEYKILQSYDPYEGKMQPDMFASHKVDGFIDKKWRVQETSEPQGQTLVSLNDFMTKFLPIFSVARLS